MVKSPFDQAKNIALMLLREHQPPTHEQIDDAIRAACLAIQSQPSTNGELDEEAIRRDIQQILSIWVPDGTELLDPTGHVPWLPDKRSQIKPDFWHRYELYLEQMKGIPQPVVARLDGLTDRILENLEDPARRGEWDRRG